MKMSNTFTGLLKTLKSTSSARESMLLSSCESELTELMHQIDIMVENKRQEWEQQLKALQFQSDRKEREIQKLREMVEHRNKEAGQLQQKIEYDADKHNNMISKYEEQLRKLKYEMENVKKNYGKLQKNSSKQSGEVDSFKEQLAAEKEKHNQAMHEKAICIEELETKIRDLETTKEVQEAKLRGMEESRKAFLEKSDAMQNQLLSYQGQLTRKKQLLDSLEQKHVMKVAELENEILRYKDELEIQSETINSLQTSLEEKRVSEEKYWKDQIEFKDEISQLKRNLQEKDKKASALEREIQSLEKTPRKHERSVSFHENSLLRKSREQEKLLAEYKAECNRLKRELQNQSSGDAFNESTNSLSKDIIKLQSQLDQRKTEHAAEVEGMRKQVASLIEELHKRDATIANMSERTAIMEDNTRELSVKHDKKDAELQVANAQLEALRLENRHLREASIDDHLTTTADLRMFEAHISDIETVNARTIAQLEHENVLLKQKLQSIRDDRELSAVDLPAKEAEAQLSLPSEGNFEDTAQERISNLQDRLDQTVNHYEMKLKELRAQNRSLSKNAENEEGGRNIVGERMNSSDLKSNTPNNFGTIEEDFNREEHDFTDFFDALRDDSVASSNNSRRQSVTREFVKAEDEREKELQSLLEARIMDLEQKTNAAIQKYGL